MRLRRLAASAAAGALAILAVPAAASASVAASPGGWRPYHTAPWTDAPGAVCSFGVAATIVYQHEQFRTLARYPNGDPRLQEFRGPLVVRYTNTSTGASAVRSLSGYGWFHYGAQSSIRAFVASHIGVTVPVGNAGFPAGEWVISGRSEVIVNSAGTISIRLIHATAEDLCRTLG